MIYMVCVCGWISKPYPDGTMFAGVGGQLSCPVCTEKRINNNIEVYGNVCSVNDEELDELGKEASWSVALSKLMNKRVQESIENSEWMGGPTSNIEEEDKREELINQELSDYLNYAPRKGVSSKEKKKYKLGVEEEEDKIRKSHRKSIREGGKYKSRGKEKRREP